MKSVSQSLISAVLLGVALLLVVTAPAAEPDAAFGAFGHKGKRALVILPSDDLIVVWNEVQIAGPAMENRALQLLLAARVLRPAAHLPAKE